MRLGGSFYNNDADDSFAFVDKAAGLAKLVGILGLGAFAAKPAIRIAGAAVTKIAMAIEGNGTSFIEKQVRRAASNFVSKADNIPSFLDNLTSDATKFFYQSVDNIEKMAITTSSNSQRTEAFAEGLSSRVTSESRQAFQDNRDQVLLHLHEMGRAGRGFESEETFLKDSHLNSFNNKMGNLGINFDFRDLREQKEVFKNVINKTAQIHAGREAVASMIADPENIKAIEDFVEKGTRFHSRRGQAFKKFMKESTDNTITWGDLVHNKNGKADLVNKSLKVMGYSHNVDDMLIHIQEKLSKVFLEKHNGRTSPEGIKALQKLTQHLHTLDTGFVVSQEKGVKTALSMAHLNKIKDKFFEKALAEVQIPLVPYKMGIPLKTLLRKYDTGKSLVNNVGRAGFHSELKRMGLAKDPNSFLISGGQSLLSFTPSEGNLKLKNVEGKFKFFDTNATPQLKKLQDYRLNYDPNYDPLDFKLHSGNESHFQKTLFNNQKHLIDLSYSPAKGFVATPKEANFAPLLDSMFGKSWNGLDVRLVHPSLVSDLVKNIDKEIMHPRDYRDAMLHIVGEASQNRFDMSSTIASLHEKVIEGKDIRVDIPASYDHSFKRLLDATGKGDVNAIIEALHFHTREFGPAMSQQNPLSNLIDDEGRSILASHASHPFYRIINSLVRDTGELSSVTKSDSSGNFHGLLDDVLGSSNISTTLSRLQEGLIAETVHGMGIKKIGDLMGRDPIKGAATLLGELREGMSIENASFQPFIKSLEKIGITGQHNVTTLLETIVRDVKTPEDEFLKTNVSKLGQLGTLLLDKKEYDAVTVEANVRAKLLQTLQRNLDEVTSVLHNKEEIHMAVLDQMAEHFDIFTTVTERFKTKSFHPQEVLNNPLTKSNFFVSPTADFNLADLILNPVETFNAQASRLFGLEDFIRGAVDPNAPVGEFGTMAQSILQIPDSYARRMGFGISSNDKVNLLRSQVSMIGKRILPLYIGYEAYKNLNSDLHQFGQPGIDDVAANSIANVGINAAKISDNLGLTPILKNLVFGTPGLDQYLNPKSEREYRKYLFYGNSEIKNNRYLLIGTRSNFAGDNLDAFQPNFFRRWKSHWTEADNADISNSAYSFLPSFHHPLAPLNRLLHPHWFEEKHREDRPYIGDGYVSKGEGEYRGEGYIGGFGAGGPSLAFEKNPDGSIGKSAYISPVKRMGDRSIEENTPWNAMAGYVHTLRNQAGLFGSFAQMLPFYPETKGAFPRQDSSAMRGISRMLWSSNLGEFTGEAGEFVRRFIPQEYIDTEAFNDRPNNMPSWVPSKIRKGDPYARVKGPGELLLPGEAFEKSHPWLQPLKVRGSMLGGTEEEIVEGWLNPMKELDGPDAEDIVDFGSEMHLQLQRKLRNNGMLVSAETSIFDKEHNISGTIDAIMKGENGLEIVDFKTQGEKSWGHTPEKYVDQITAYMAITGIDKAHLIFINRDNTQQVRIENFNFDPQRWNTILGRIEKARETVGEMVKQKLVSPYETYDLLSRIEVLSKVAPDSSEFRKAVSFAEKAGGFGGFEKDRYEQSLEEARKLSNPLNLYPYRNVKTVTIKAKVISVEKNGMIVTDKGTYKLAGVKMDHQAFIYEDPPSVFAKFGVYTGKLVDIEIVSGTNNPGITNTTAVEAIVRSLGRNVNRDIAASDYASADVSTRTPLGNKVVRGTGLGASIGDRILHSDNILSNKFLRVRSGLEEYKRGEVYGTNNSRLNKPISTIIQPTLESLASKNPIVGAAAGAIALGSFAVSKKGRTVAMAIGASLGASLSLSRILYEKMSGVKWVPKRVRKKGEQDEYWDMLSYLKYISVSEQAKVIAKTKEGVDIDKLKNSPAREYKEMGPYAVLALEYDKKAKSTMYGYDVVRGNLQQALAAIPRRHKQIAENIILYGSKKEKQEFYDLLPMSEKRVLGRYIGIDKQDLPNKPNVSAYFSIHFLPQSNWTGWDVAVDMNDLEKRSTVLENINVATPSRKSLDRARAYSQNVSIPKIRGRTPGLVRARVESVIREANIGLEYEISVNPATRSSINVNMDLKEDRTHAIQDRMRKEMLP